MKKLTVISIVVASLLLIGCGQEKAEQTKGEVGTSTKTETVMEKATKAVEATKEAASAVIEKTTQVAKEATAKAVEATKEVATKAIEKTAQVAKDVKDSVSPKAEAPEVFAKCTGCHGKDGKMKALGKSETIAGQSKADLVKKIHEYKAGTRNTKGMGGLMKTQVASLSDADIDAIATYVSELK